MDFLYKLYSNENFGIILFVIISILVLTFLIILFFGKKDQKQRELEETNKLEVSDEVAFHDEEAPIPVEIVKEEPIPEPEAVATNFVSANAVLNSDLVSDSNHQEDNFLNQVPNPEEIDLPKQEFDFDALAASISKELESITGEENPTESPVQMKPVVEEVPTPIITPVMEDPIIKNFQAEPVENIAPKEENTLVEEEMKKPTIPSPTQFSSVFVNKKGMENKIEEKREVVEEVKLNTPVTPVTPTPVKPSFELPKPIDLPKLNSEPIKEPTPTVINAEVKPIIEEPNSNVVFPNLNNENQVFQNNQNERM